MSAKESNSRHLFRRILPPRKKEKKKQERKVACLFKAANVWLWRATNIWTNEQPGIQRERGYGGIPLAPFPRSNLKVHQTGKPQPYPPGSPCIPPSWFSWNMLLWRATNTQTPATIQHPNVTPTPPPPPTPPTRKSGPTPPPPRLPNMLLWRHQAFRSLASRQPTSNRAPRGAWAPLSARASFRRVAALLALNNSWSSVWLRPPEKKSPVVINSC